MINRDLDRQFPFHEMFLSKDGHGYEAFLLCRQAPALLRSSVSCVCVCRQRGLFRVLKSYTQYKPEEGYCQAQGPVAAVLLMNMPAEVTTASEKTGKDTSEA